MSLEKNLIKSFKDVRSDISALSTQLNILAEKQREISKEITKLSKKSAKKKK